MSAIALTRIQTRTRELVPGFIVSLIVAAAASFLSEHYGAPVMLFALLLGMALNFLADDGPCKVGVEFTARTVLRIGVALLGMRITLEQMAALGWKPMVLVVILVVLTIAASVIAAKFLGFSRLFGMLTGGATAICGASA
ncbi:MAG: putative sulfate exporter family transporter, partial [Pseudomonas sp.]